MLVKIALVLLLVWVPGVLRIYDAGDYVHVLLFAGLMLLLVAFLKAREAVRTIPRDANDSQRPH